MITTEEKTKRVGVSIFLPVNKDDAKDLLEEISRARRNNYFQTGAELVKNGDDYFVMFKYRKNGE